MGERGAPQKGDAGDRGDGMPAAVGIGEWMRMLKGESRGSRRGSVRCWLVARGMGGDTFCPTRSRNPNLGVSENWCEKKDSDRCCVSRWDLPY